MAWNDYGYPNPVFTSVSAVSGVCPRARHQSQHWDLSLAIIERFKNRHLRLIGFGNCARPPDVDGCLYSRNVIKSAILLDGDPFWAEIEFSGLGPSRPLFLTVISFCRCDMFCANEMHVRRCLLLALRDGDDCYWVTGLVLAEYMSIMCHPLSSVCRLPRLTAY